MDVISTEFGEVRVKPITDYNGREGVKIELVPADGCARVHTNEMLRELPVPPAKFPTETQLAALIGQGWRWLQRKQPDNARYPSHFGVDSPALSECVRVAFAPGYVWVKFGGPRMKSLLTGNGFLRPIIVSEHAIVRRAVKRHFTVTDDWHGADFHSFTVANVASPSNQAAYARYGDPDVFSKSSIRRGNYDDLQHLPEGWKT